MLAMAAARMLFISVAVAAVLTVTTITTAMGIVTGLIM